VGACDEPEAVDEPCKRVSTAADDEEELVVWLAEERAAVALLEVWKVEVTGAEGYVARGSVGISVSCAAIEGMVLVSLLLLSLDPEEDDAVKGIVSARTVDSQANSTKLASDKPFILNNVAHALSPTSANTLLISKECVDASASA
jgi:hypothetical protein